MIRVRILLVAALCAATGSGCAALTNPLVDSIPVRNAPPELVPTVAKDKLKSIPLELLQQPPSDEYRLDTGDLLGIWIEGIIGERGIPIPIFTFDDPSRLARSQAPGAGYPFPVREDGTVQLPLIDAVPVRGMSKEEAQKAIRQQYTGKGLLPPGRDKMLVTLLHKRQFEVVVLRQEAGAFGVGPEGGTSTAGKRGSGAVINLAAYENDVLHALSLTGGLPGLDAYNAVVIYRGLSPRGTDRQALMQQPELLSLSSRCPVVRIPLRHDPSQPLTFGPQDVILQTGDVVYLEPRDREVFFTAGLLPTAEHLLPRDRDLDVLTAVSLVRGPMINSSFGSNTLTGAVFPAGIGQPSASLLVVLRRTPNGDQVPIRVDLNRAARDPRERIVVQPGDLLILQERPGEALARYASQTFSNFQLLWSPIHGPNEQSVVDLAAPDRQPGRGLIGANSQQ